MAIIERDVLLQGREDGQDTIDLPITRLGNVEDGAKVKAAPAEGDYIPVIDSEDNYEMKKTPADRFALKSDLTSLYRFKGSVANFAALPAADNAAGDVWNAESTGMNYAWTGSEWDALGAVFEVESITNAEIDAILSGD